MIICKIYTIFCFRILCYEKNNLILKFDKKINWKVKNCKSKNRKGENGKIENVFFILKIEYVKILNSDVEIIWEMLWMEK